MKKFPSHLAKLTFLSLALIAVAPAIAFAQSTVSADANTNVLVDTMCNVMQIITGNAGKAFAAFAIISIGIGFFTGKVSWGLMIGVAAGIAAMFGAPTIVAAITGKGAYSCG
jgi:type IV secretion system protein VirB2